MTVVDRGDALCLIRLSLTFRAYRVCIMGECVFVLTLCLYLSQSLQHLLNLFCHVEGFQCLKNKPEKDACYW